MTQRERPLQLVAAGDVMMTRQLSTFDHPGFEPIKNLVQAADASLANLEVLLHDYESPPAANGPGTYMRAPPWVADELLELGFDLLATATNHSMDYGHGGMRATMTALEERNIPNAGMGRSLSDARAPCYVDTGAGRVGMVAACSTVTPGSQAGPSARGMKPRPGISPLEYDTVYRLPSEAYERVREVSEELGLDRYKEHVAELGFPIAEPDSGFRFLALGADSYPIIEQADEFQVERIPKEDDVDAILRQIRDARRQADWVVASLHYHEGRGARGTDETVPAFVESFARDCVDAGADAFVGHGSHCLRGIELYDGAPLFYSLGNFVAQNDLVERLPQEMYDRHGLGAESTPADLFDARGTADDGSPRSFAAFPKYYETVLPVCSFTDQGLEEVTLYPVDLRRDRDRPVRGQPILATSDTAESILTRLRDLSEPFGTELALDGETATIAP